MRIKCSRLAGLRMGQAGLVAYLNASKTNRVREQFKASGDDVWAGLLNPGIPAFQDQKKEIHCLKDPFIKYA